MYLSNTPSGISLVCLCWDEKQSRDIMKITSMWMLWNVVQIQCYWEKCGRITEARLERRLGVCIKEVGGWGSQWSLKGFSQPTDLLGELLASEEEAQQAADDHGQNRQDEQSVLLADILHSAPHFFQSHPPPPPPPAARPGPDCNFATLRENHQSKPPFLICYSAMYIQQTTNNCSFKGGRDSGWM